MREKLLPFSSLDKKEKLKRRKEAYNIWMNRKAGAENTPIYLETIAHNVGMTIKQLKYYMKKDQWIERLKKDQKNGTLEKRVKKSLNVLNEKVSKKELNSMNKILEESGLPERFKLFILYYLQSYNTTNAAIKAGYAKTSAHARGFELINDKRVKAVLEKLKALMSSSLYIDGKDILAEYVKIAFADMTDYVEFDNNAVKLKDSNQVDGRLITEVRKGRDGVTIKLADKMKAMDKLEKLFAVIPDQKLQLEREKFEFQKQLAKKGISTGSQVIIVNDVPQTEGDE